MANERAFFYRPTATGPTAERRITLTREFVAPREKVFEAITVPEYLHARLEHPFQVIRVISES